MKVQGTLLSLVRQPCLLANFRPLRLVGFQELQDRAAIHAHDIGTILDQEGIAIRTGHHCSQPVMDYFGVPATARASFSFYNTMEEVDALVRGLRKVQEVFS